MGEKRKRKSEKKRKQSEEEKEKTGLFEKKNAIACQENLFEIKLKLESFNNKLKLRVEKF